MDSPKKPVSHNSVDGHCGVIGSNYLETAAARAARPVSGVNTHGGTSWRNGKLERYNFLGCLMVPAGVKEKGDRWCKSLTILL